MYPEKISHRPTIPVKMGQIGRSWRNRECDKIGHTARTETTYPGVIGFTVRYMNSNGPNVLGEGESRDLHSESSNFRTSDHGENPSLREIRSSRAEIDSSSDTKSYQAQIIRSALNGSNHVTNLPRSIPEEIKPHRKPLGLKSDYPLIICAWRIAISFLFL